MWSINTLVKRYITRFDKELKMIETASPELQKLVFESVVKAPLVRHLFGDQLDACGGQYHIFQKCVPTTEYMDYKQAIDELMKSTDGPVINYYAKSSGTASATQKLIPVTENFVRINHLRASWYILHTLYRYTSDMSVFNRQNLLVGGSIYERNNNYVIGDVSGIMLYRIPVFFRPYCIPDIQTATMPQWTDKIDRTARLAAKSKDISLIIGSPVWVLTILKKVLEMHPHMSLNSLWPKATCLVHGGVSFAPYKSQFESIFQQADFKYLETYNASEGFFAFQNDLSDPGLLLMTNNGIFFEFITVENYKTGNRQAIPIEEVRTGQSYVLVISTITGLLRYIIGDVIQFVSLRPFKIVVKGRVTDYINAFGEDLLADQAEEAISQTALQFGVGVRNYTVAPWYVSMEERGYHEWYIEFENQPSGDLAFARCLDDMLCKLNPNYAQKRQGDLALMPLRIINLPHGCFETYLMMKGKLNGQGKIQRLRNDRTVADDLCHILNQYYGNYKRTGSMDLADDRIRTR